MNLRWTILGLILIAFAGLVLVFSISLQTILTPHFDAEEQRSSSLNIQRVMGVLENNFNSLTDTARDWSRWDDTYAFVLNANPAFIQANLGNETFTDLRINLMAFYSSDGRLYFGKAFDLQQNQEIGLPPALAAGISPADPLLRSAEDNTPLHGILATSGAPLMFVSVPILRTDGRGPAAGTLILGRYLDSGELQRIAGVVQFPLTLARYDQPGLAQDWQTALANLSPENPTFNQPLSEIEYAGYVLLNDYQGQPSYILRIDQARTLYRNSQLVLRYLYIILISGTVLFGLIVFLFMDRLVLTRLRQLGNEVVSVGRWGNLNARVRVSGKDELSRLAVTINQMLSDLQQAQNRRRESEERFQAVVESMGDMVFIIDQNMRRLRFFGAKARRLGISERVNLPATLAESALSVEEFEALARSMHFPTVTLRDHLNAFQEAQTGRHVVYEWTLPFEQQFLRFQTVLSPVQDERQRITGIVGVSRDITQLKMLEAALRQRVQELNALNGLARAFLEKTDSQWVAQESCRLLVEQFNLDAAWVAVLDEEKYALVPLAYRGIALPEDAHIPLLEESESPSHPILKAHHLGQTLTYRIPDIPGGNTLLEGERSFLNLLCIPLISGDFPLLLAVYSLKENAFSPAVTQLVQAVGHLMAMAISNADLFEQVRMDQERMQNLSHRLVEIQEEESKRIAMELHDEIGQLLTGLKLQLDISEKFSLPEQKEHLERARGLADDLLQKVRNLSLDLRPSMLDDLGLLPALLWHFDRYTTLTGVKILFQQHNLENRRFQPEVETVAYRVVQEALTNVARHARVSEVSVRLLFSQDQLTILVEDRGKGFSTTQILGRGRTRGLMSIRERVGLVGGTLTIDSVPGWGTSLQIELPVKERQVNDHDTPR